MDTKKTATLGILLLIAGIIILGVWTMANNAGPKGTFSAMEIQSPNILVDGMGFSKVEIWAVPTGTGITKDDYQLVGNAYLISTNNQGGQSWSLPIPKEPLSITSLFARGYNSKGRVDAEITLPAVGATELYTELWGSATTSVQ